MLIQKFLDSIFDLIEVVLVDFESKSTPFILKVEYSCRCDPQKVKK